MIKPLKKIITGALVPMVMAAMMSLTAFAGTASSFEIPVSVNVTEGAPANTYTVKIEAENNAPMPSASELKYTDGVVTQSFENFTFPKPDDYTYVITQTTASKENFTLDTTTYKITVRVTNSTDGDGTFDAACWAVQDKVVDEKPAEISFSNTYKKPDNGNGNGNGGGGGGGNSSRRPTGDALIGDDGIPLAVLGAFEEDPIPLAVLPMTGDVTNMAIWMLMFFVSAVGLASTLVIRKRTA